MITYTELMNELPYIDLSLLTGGVATLVCVVLDMIMHRIQAWQMERAGVGNPSTLGFGGRLALSLVMNLVLCMGFAYTYSSIGVGSGNSFLVAAVIWLMIAIPMLATSRFTDEIRQQTIAIRILIWLLKMSAVAGVVAFFMD